ncbi:hypothetical protein GGQ84_002140 [Desulfitispora alkaliphila]|uniref:ribonuclease H-like YkuK family protein n=1 Tax=Desulfitispora alkaliphila TaxID=622674 RepID=UPI003D192D90
MKSITYGEVSFKQVCNILEDIITGDKKAEHIICVGTDSQNMGDITKIVTVITLIRKTKGGIFFYESRKIKKITNLRQKIFLETQSSIEMANKVMNFVKERGIQAALEVHVDIGEKGETKDLIKEIVGWVIGMGFVCRLKPDSFASAVVADKITKVGTS